MQGVIRFRRRQSGVTLVAILLTSQWGLFRCSHLQWSFSSTDA